MPALWLAQLLCPERHAICALAYDADETSRAEVELKLRAVVGTPGGLDPWCALCRSRDLRIEHGKLATNNWTLALALLQDGERAQLETREWFCSDPEAVVMSAPTFCLHTVAGVTAIECLLCGRISELPGDVANRYCARCHLFHEVVAEGRRLLAEGGTHECEEWRTFRGRCALCDVLLTKAGTFYGVTAGGRMLELDAREASGRPPDKVICRRVADYPRGVPPAAATIGRCAQCAAPIAFNAAKFPEQPHVCMQCAQIHPEPYPKETP